MGLTNGKARFGVRRAIPYASDPATRLKTGFETGSCKSLRQREIDFCGDLSRSGMQAILVDVEDQIDPLFA